MTSEYDKKKNENDVLIERDIVSGRTFSIGEAIGREGAGLLKGESTIPVLVRAAAEINSFIDTNLHDPSGALKHVLKASVNGNRALLSKNRAFPVEALREIIGEILKNQACLDDFVHGVDFKWGQMNNEPPHFQKQGEPPHPDDEYTISNIKEALKKILELIPE